MKPQIGAYCRISYDRDGRELGIERQLADLTSLADKRGWEIAATFIDNDVSAFNKSITRPAFEQLYDRLKSDKTLGIASYDLDRLWRQPRDLERIIDLYENTKRPFATIQGDVDLSTSNGRAMARVMVAFANKSSEDTARRIKRKIQEQAENGQPHWGKRPYGYNLDGTLDPEEAPVVRRIGEQFLNGYSYRDITYRLNEDGIFSRAGKPWTVGNIRRFMVAERFAAIRLHDGVEYVGSWTPIFTRDEWARIQHLVKARKEPYADRPKAKKYLLTGMLYCACGGFLHGMTKRDGKMKSLPEGRLRRTYQCPSSSATERRTKNCASTTVGAEPLEHFLKEAIIMRLDSPELASYLAEDASGNEQLPALLAERAEVDASLNELASDYYTHKLLSRDEFFAARGSTQGRLRALDRTIDSLRVSRFKLDLSAGETVRQAWDERPDSWRRELMEVLIEKVVINKSSMKPYYVFDNKKTRFDANRVEIAWKV